MKNYKSILAGEVRRRKYFRRKAKKYHCQLIQCEGELKGLRHDVRQLSFELERMKQMHDYEIDRRVKDGIAAERFAIEYDYCQKIDYLTARLDIYETADLSASENIDLAKADVGMVLTSEQCKRLEEHLRKMRSISNKYKEVCRLMRSINAVVDE